MGAREKAQEAAETIMMTESYRRKPHKARTSRTGIWRAVMLALALILGGASFCAKASAEEAVSRTVAFRMQGADTQEMTFKLYRVGTVENGRFALNENCSPSGVDVDFDETTTADKWAASADTLYTYIKAHTAIRADQTRKTDANGEMSFYLEKKILYLIASDDEVTDGDATYRALPMYLWQIEGDMTTIEIKPADSATGSKRYTLVKHWVNDKEADRPVSIKAELYENDKLTDTVILNSGNDWTYSWEDEDGDGVWTCLEKEVPEGYNVIVDTAENGAKFILTNTAKDKKKDPEPKESEKKKKEKKANKKTDGTRTGDPMAWKLSEIALFFAGFALILAAVRRSKRA